MQVLDKPFFNLNIMAQILSYSAGAGCHKSIVKPFAACHCAECHCASGKAGPFRRANHKSLLDTPPRHSGPVETKSR